MVITIRAHIFSKFLEQCLPYNGYSVHNGTFLLHIDINYIDWGKVSTLCLKYMQHLTNYRQLNM